MMYAPCESTDDGAIKMNNESITAQCLDFSSKCTCDDLFYHLHRTKSTTSMEIIRKLEKFAVQVGYIKPVSTANQKQKVPWQLKFIESMF